jgi:hypothetical protein
MFASTKKPLQVRMGKEKVLLTLGFIVLDNSCNFELSQHNLN